MLTGMRRSKSKSKDSRLPITYNILKEITSVLPAICSSDFEICLVTAAFVLAQMEGYMQDTFTYELQDIQQCLFASEQ
jgi:hypothetical protein